MIKNMTNIEKAMDIIREGNIHLKLTEATLRIVKDVNNIFSIMEFTCPFHIIDNVSYTCLADENEISHDANITTECLECWNKEYKTIEETVKSDECNGCTDCDCEFNIYEPFSILEEDTTLKDNTELFDKLLKTYKWYSAYDGLEVFLEIWLSNIVNEYSVLNDGEMTDGKMVKQAKHALEMLEIVRDEYYFINNDIAAFNTTPTDKDYDLNDELIKKVRKDLFKYIGKHYKTWWN